MKKETVSQIKKIEKSLEARASNGHVKPPNDLMNKEVINIKKIKNERNT